MDVQPQEPEGKKTVTYLVTGANRYIRVMSVFGTYTDPCSSGLGFGICCRLIDEFLQTRPQSESLHLLFSTRDKRKSEDTLNRLNAHFQKTLKEADARMPGASLLLEPRVKLEGVLVDLTKLLTVKALAQQLLKRGQRLDGVVWNAGIAGWLRLSWLHAFRDILMAPIESTTYPEYMVCDVGALAPRQLGGYGKVHTFEEPRLGQVFTANVFGHYMLTHWLSPLMDADTRIVWISSISALSEAFDVKDLQCFAAERAYEGSKRLSDLLVLTSELPAAEKVMNDYLPSKKGASRPKMYSVHPGVVATSISGLNAFISIFMLAALYFVRWIGSPWHPITPYKGAISAVYALLSPDSQLPHLEVTEGKGKWGSSCSVTGEERVARTEVEGWGYTGVVDAKEPAGVVRARRPKYQGPVTKESRGEFEKLGLEVWGKMEELRKEWEGRLGRIDADEVDSADA